MNPIKNSQIKFRTCFSSVSEHGYKLDILKSGIQKYLRRRELDKMIWCVLEIYKFQVHSKTEKDKKMAKGIITNLVNRLIITMDEELLFTQYSKYLVLRNLLNTFDNDRDNGEKLLILICKMLIEAELYRFPSDVRAYWDYRFRFGNYEAKDVINSYEEGLDTAEKWFNRFISCFETNSDEMYFWMFKIFNSGLKSTPVFRKKKETIYKIWKMLFELDYVKDNDNLTKLLEYKLEEFNNKNRGERFMFMVNCIQLLRDKSKLLISTINLNDLEKEYSLNSISDEKYNFWYDLTKCKLIIDDYVIDMHTSQGRKLGKNRKDFALEGSTVVNQNQRCQDLYKDWRDYYIQEKLDNPVKNKKGVKEKTTKIKKKLVIKKNNDSLKINITISLGDDKKSLSREELRSFKYKRIKKMRGNPKFEDLETKLEYIVDINADNIKLCSDMTCGNKVMCFEYNGKIWKESRKSMNYNRDYCVVDECKELFGLNKIGMKRILSNFRLEKIDKSKKSWKDNWHKVMIGEDEEKVVYCVMNKITNCMWKIPMEFGVIKHSILYGVKNGGNVGKNKELFKEFVKIGVYRGIFRCSDFNSRNVLVGLESDPCAKQYLVSIDEGDIGKRLDILGAKEKWIIEGLNQDKTIINEILEELSYQPHIIQCLEKMEKYKFSLELINEVESNWKNLKEDLELEGVKFD